MTVVRIRGNRFFGTAIFICVTALLVGKTHSQSGREPKLVHKHTEHFCEYGRGSIDLFLSDLLKDEKAKGVIVLHPSISDPLWPYKEKGTIENHLAFRRFDAKRVEILLGEPELVSSTEQWLLAQDATGGFKTLPWDMSMANLKQPLMVHSKTWVDGIGCGLFEFNHAFFADILRKNPSFVGRVVIRENSAAKFEAAKERVLQDLVGRRNKVPPGQLEVAFLKYAGSDVEYWLLPANM